MTQIKIVSNPYDRSLEYYIYKEQTGTWDNIKRNSINSRLRENDEERIFLPFTIKEIIDTIVSEYYAGSEKIEVIFEGTTDEHDEIISVCDDNALSESRMRMTRMASMMQ